MEENDLRDLMNRLRFATGKSTAEPVQEITTSSVSEESLLIVQQALRRHPALVHLHKSRDELKMALLKLLEDSFSDGGLESDDVHQILGWMNKISESLEIERLATVYSDPSLILSELSQSIVEELGVPSLPTFSQNNPGNLSPWHILLGLVVSPLLSVNERHHKRVELHFSNPTPSMVMDLVEINKNTYRTTSWISLLNALGDFPIKSVRHIWQAALFIFPTSGRLVVAYMREELNDIAKHRFLWEENDADSAKETYRAYCRVLNYFFRHLSLCFNVELYRMFFDFLERYIKPDDLTWDTLFKTALQRDIGHCPGSTDIWKRYIKWKSDRIQDTHQRREWVRKMYVRVLRTPLNDLQEVKEDYDYFLKSEYRGRPPFDNRLDERLARARGAATEVGKLMGSLFSGSSMGANGDALPRLLYLPRPVKLHDLDPNLDPREETMRRIEIELWSVWMILIDRERNSSAYSGMELFGYERVRFFMAVRSSVFPHQAFTWIYHVDYCLHHQPLLSEIERRALARNVLEKAYFLLPGNSYLQTFYCDSMLNDLADADCAHKRMKELLILRRQLVVDYIKDQTLSTLDHILGILESISLLSINWMRWGSLSKDVTAAQHVRLVARFTMHRVDLLSLIIGTIRRAASEEKSFTPGRCLRVFNTFCHYWIKIEIHRNSAFQEALLILQRWKDHLKMFLTSIKEKEWPLGECGVDEIFFSSCVDIGKCNPLYAKQVVEYFDELAHVIMDSRSFGAEARKLLSEKRQSLCDAFFLNNTDTTHFIFHLLPSYIRNVRPTGPTVPIQTYDHDFFASDLYFCDEHITNEEGTVTHFPAPSLVENIPDDARWRPCVISARAHTGTEGRKETKAEAENDAKWKRIKRPPNKRSQVTNGTSLIQDLPSAFQQLGLLEGRGVNLQQVENLMTRILPTAHETDELFKDRMVHSEWLVKFLEEMDALH